VVNLDIIILCHTEFGFVHDKIVIPDKKAINGVKEGVSNLLKISNRYGAKVTFAVMHEVVQYFPRDANHEIGLHIHPGWVEFNQKGFKFFVGDSYLKEHCNQSVNSTVLPDYSYREQLEMIKIGKEYLDDKLETEVTSFVAGRWSINNDSVKALIKLGITHECSATPSFRPCHHDWSKLPRICMPYSPNKSDYQKKGNLNLLIVPISQMLLAGNVNPEVVSSVGLSWLKACFLEYYKQNLPLFHICLHSPCMTNQYFISAMDDLISFISKHKNINFNFASEIAKYSEVNPKTNIFPYLLGINRGITINSLKAIQSKASGVKK